MAFHMAYLSHWMALVAQPTAVSYVVSGVQALAVVCMVSAATPTPTVAKAASPDHVSNRRRFQHLHQDQRR